MLLSAITRGVWRPIVRRQASDFGCLALSGQVARTRSGRAGSKIERAPGEHVELEEGWLGC